MSDGEEHEDRRREFPFSVRQTLVLVVAAVLVMYFSASVTTYLGVPPAERDPTMLLFPFRGGPSAQNLHDRGVKAFRGGRYRQSVRYFSRSLRKDPENPKGLFLLASARAKQGEFREAFEVLRPLQGQDVGLPRLHARKAYWFLGLGRYDRAKGSARRYVGASSVSDQNKLYGYLVLYTAELLVGDEQGARAPLEEARSLNLPEDSWPSVMLDSLVRGRSPSDASVGERTEFRAWRALINKSRGKVGAARRDRQWVLEKGVESRYEHDLMLATKASGLF